MLPDISLITYSALFPWLENTCYRSKLTTLSFSFKKEEHVLRKGYKLFFNTLMLINCACYQAEGCVFSDLTGIVPEFL